MHRRLGSATLSQLVFPGESNKTFPWEKSQWDDTVVNKKYFAICEIHHEAAETQKSMSRD